MEPRRSPSQYLPRRTGTLLPGCGGGAYRELIVREPRTARAFRSVAMLAQAASPCGPTVAVAAPPAAWLAEGELDMYRKTLLPPPPTCNCPLYRRSRILLGLPLHVTWLYANPPLRVSRSWTAIHQSKLARSFQSLRTLRISPSGHSVICANHHLASIFVLGVSETCELLFRLRTAVSRPGVLSVSVRRGVVLGRARATMTPFTASRAAKTTWHFACLSSAFSPSVRRLP